MSPELRLDRFMMRLIGRADEASCREAARHLQAFLDGQVEPGHGERIAKHLETCRRCGLEADTYTKIKQSIRRQGGPVDTAAVQRLNDFGADLLARGEPDHHEPPTRRDDS